MAPTSAVEHEVEIASHGFTLAGRLTLPNARGLIVFAHDVGTQAWNMADRQVARCFHDLGFGSLLVDLALPDEIHAGVDPIDLEVFAIRLLVATRWLRAQTQAAGSQIGYFGVRAGAAVALLAAADDQEVGAIVTRSARLELVASVLPSLPTPTLLLVGSGDATTRIATERSLAALGGPHQVAVVPGASELFVESGVLEVSARLSGSWFGRHLHSDETRTINEP